jgi:predicted nucleotide-binding protein
MPLKFTQSFEDLKAILVKLDSAGEWVDLNQNQKQFRHESGAILNWFPSTGTINFQGKSAAAVELEKTVGALLNQEPAEAPPSVLASGAENQTYSTDLPQFTIDELSRMAFS